MSEVDGRFIKRGLWTNVDQGSVMGKTITTDSTSGAIIIAMMAVLSTVGTSHIWNLLVFSYHQMRADGRPSDGLFRQQQALLRTLLPPSSLMAESAKLWWSWRRRNDKVMLRSMTQFLLATACTFGFIAASISSSFVVNSSDLEVLVESSSCGHVDYALPLDAYRAQVAAIRAISLPYAQECYRNQTILPARCKAYVRPSISFTSEKVPCPFDSSFCLTNSSKTQQAFAVDSGPVDLNSGFGLNLPRRDRVSYRRRTTCAVLPIAGHTTVMNATDFPKGLLEHDELPGEELMLFHYGERPDLGKWKNMTMLSSLLAANLSRSTGLSGLIYSPAQERGGIHNSFLTLAGMRRDDADVAVIFNSNTIKYTKPVDDPWFLARQTVIWMDLTTGSNITLYMAETPRKAMGCTIQHQLCIKSAHGDECSKLDSLPVNVTLKDWPRASPVQLSALQLVVGANQNIGLTHANTVRLAEKVRSDGVVVSQVPPDQWTSEAQGMESFVWASTQVLMSDYAIGPGLRTPDVSDYVISPAESGDKQLCKSQKMRKAGGFVNVNVFGMVFVITVSIFFAIVDILLLRVLIFLDKLRPVLSPRIERWIQDGVLQLQRRAYEAHGEGTWSQLDKEIPLTRPNQKLDELPLASVPLPKSPTVSTPPNGAQSPRPVQTQPQATPTQTSQAQSTDTQPAQPRASPQSPTSPSLNTASPSLQPSSTQTPVQAGPGAPVSASANSGFAGPPPALQQTSSSMPPVSQQQQQPQSSAGSTTGATNTGSGHNAGIGSGTTVQP